MNTLPFSSPRELRLRCREGDFDRPTAGCLGGYVQANLVALPAALADDFRLFCLRNPKPCPVLEVTAPGDTEPRRLAPGADLRHDLPRYRVFRGGELVEEVGDAAAHWREDLTAFLIGCSFTFEWAMAAAGLPLRHIEEGVNVPMYRTNRPCRDAGPFRGPLVVSMRPMTPAEARHAAAVTAPYHRAHGAPMHVGDPEELGITDLARPDYGDRVSIREGEVPVFWGCGVTPQEIMLNARPDLAITHAPGHMFVTDLTSAALLEEPDHPSGQQNVS